MSTKLNSYPGEIGAQDKLNSQISESGKFEKTQGIRSRTLMQVLPLILGISCIYKLQHIFQ
jgi:hypothetical protein